MRLPWSKSLSASSGEFLQISAQNHGDRGDVTVTILVDGQMVKTATSSGGYVIAGTDYLMP